MVRQEMKRNQKAWLLTWEWIGDHAAVEDRIAGILRPGLETISWVLSPLYRLNRTTLEKELIRGALLETVTRTILGPLSDREIGRYRP